MMTNAEHLIKNAVTALELHDPYEAYSIFMYNPRNAEMAALAGVSLDAVWEMAVYCDTTLWQDWKEKWEKEAERWIPVTERLPGEWTEVLVFVRCRPGAEGFLQTAVYIGNPGCWRIAWNHYLLDDNSVTHWMPLPDAPGTAETGKDDWSGI